MKYLAIFEKLCNQLKVTVLNGQHSCCFSIIRYYGIPVLQTQVSVLSFNSDRRAVVSSLYRP